ncbi:hypothetical protein FACS189426_17630 [Bacteroidia bacterium]|nr:hypothetical protein FACS189426_17630 [Bacteroidia bacterium]
MIVTICFFFCFTYFVQAQADKLPLGANELLNNLNNKDMNTLLVKKVKNKDWKASELSETFDKEKIPFHAISNVNWSEYPYKPDVKFRIAHDGKNILLNYQVEESDIKAVSGEDNGKIWEDACVEFFVTFDNESYYNIECNCIGKLLAGTGAGRQSRKHVTAELLNHIDRWSSLGYLPLENKSGKWELSLVIPIDVFILNQLDSLDGLQAKANFYKCGDKLKTPHFLSWNPIKTERPDFHLPQYFGEIRFE